MAVSLFIVAAHIQAYRPVELVLSGGASARGKAHLHTGDMIPASINIITTMNIF